MQGLESNQGGAPPAAMNGRRLVLLVAGSAGAILLTEIVLTRLLSVLLFYHYSFLAISVALFGLAWGGLRAANRPLGDDGEALARVAWSRLTVASAALLALLFLMTVVPPAGPDGLRALVTALLTALPLMLLGEVLARSLAIGRGRINRLYAVDLIASAGAALLAIPLLTRVQGPVALAVPALAAAVLAASVAPRHRRPWNVGFTAVLGVGVLAAGAAAGPALQLTDPWFGQPLLERWNAYSRVRVRVAQSGQLELVIDRTASSIIPRVPPPLDGGPPPIDPRWAEEYADPSYALGRRPQRVAVIGVGGGPDLLSALAAGAREIVGFELNDRIVDLLTESLSRHTAVARRPEVRLVRDEARHALEGSDRQYDVIRASLIDTWASTAAGGFVLSENGLYTFEAWRLFLRRLTPSGLLAVTRWHLPAAPAEAERLVALAAEAVEAERLEPAGDRIVALALPSDVYDPLSGQGVQTITTLVSRAPFTRDEVGRLEAFAGRRGGTLLIAPFRFPAPVAERWPALLNAPARERYVRDSPWAIAPPRDSRPFFFLQLRPRDVLRFDLSTYGPVSAITVNGVRVLVASVLFALAGAGLLLVQVGRLRRDSNASARSGATLSRAGQLYFALLGFGYMVVQLALHQRLAVVLGHPTPTLALVIAAMLLGTGLGSGAAGATRLGRSHRVLIWPLGAVAALVALFPHLGRLSSAPGMEWTAAGAGLLSLAMGAALGVALPTGMRLLAAGERNVAEAWAINGAFSVLGASLGAFAGLMLGSRGLTALALPCYMAALLIAWRAAGLAPADRAGAVSDTRSPSGELLRPRAP